MAQEATPSNSSTYRKKANHTNKVRRFFVQGIQSISVDELPAVLSKNFDVTGFVSHVRIGEADFLADGEEALTLNSAGELLAFHRLEDRYRQVLNKLLAFYIAQKAGRQPIDLSSPVQIRSWVAS